MKLNSNNGLRDRVIFFDGECFMCSNLVTYILKRDHHQHLYFASIQSGILDQLDKANSKKEMDTLIFYEDNIFHERSDAVLRIMKYLPFWKNFLFLKYIPLKWRDFCYDIIARNRYKIWGKRESCMLPEDKWRSRFIQ